MRRIPSVPRAMPLVVFFALFLFIICFYAPSYSDRINYEEDLIRIKKQVEKEVREQQKARVVFVLVNSDFISKQIGQGRVIDDWDSKIVTLECKDENEVLSPGSAYWGAIYSGMFSAASGL